MTLVDIVFIGIGLAIDASCVSACNGLMYKPSIIGTLKIAVVFAVFQTIMPLLGYWGVGLVSFQLLEYNHLMALVLLSALGIKMIYESFGEIKESDVCKGDAEYSLNNQNASVSAKLTGGVLLMQGITTSIDALSVGITFNNYDARFVLYAVVLIGLITMIMCGISVRIGCEIGTKLNTKAELLGGMVLILLGIKIFVMGG